MDLTTQEYEELQKLAAAAAKRVSFQWPDVVEQDDLAHDMIVYLLESPGTLRRLFEEDEPTRRSFMVKVAHRMASDSMTDYERFSGNYLYDTAEVRGYLERQVWLHDLDRFRAEKADLQEGLDNLADRGSNHYAELINRFEHEIVPDRLESTAHSRISRAVEALTEEMNRIGATRRKNWVEGPGSRFVGAVAE